MPFKAKAEEFGRDNAIFLDDCKGNATSRGERSGFSEIDFFSRQRINCASLG